MGARRAWQRLVLAFALLTLPGPGRAKPRDGAAPHGVSVQAALASAKKLQPELFAGLPEAFLPEYKAPCWWRNQTDSPETALDAVSGTELRCLPYFYVLGDFNCGVRDLTDRVVRPPVGGSAA